MTESFISYSKVAGVIYEGRQEHLKNLIEGQYLILIRETDNPHDRYAVRIDALIKSVVHNIGFIQSKGTLNIDLWIAIKAGKDIKARVKKITGLSEGNLGCNIEIFEELLKELGLR